MHSVAHEFDVFLLHSQLNHRVELAVGSGLSVCNTYVFRYFYCGGDHVQYVVFGSGLNGEQGKQQLLGTQQVHWIAKNELTEHDVLILHLQYCLPSQNLLTQVKGYVFHLCHEETCVFPGYVLPLWECEKVSLLYDLSLLIHLQSVGQMQRLDGLILLSDIVKQNQVQFRHPAIRFPCRRYLGSL